MGGGPGPDSRRTSRDRLSHIGHHFLSDARRQLHVSLFAGHDNPYSLRATDLARALACLGARVAVIDEEHRTIQNFRLLSEPDTISVSNMRGELRGGQTGQTGYADPLRDAEIMIIESSTIAHADTTAPLVLLSTPADAAGMRQAWFDLKTLACRMTPPAVGVTITGAISFEEAEYGYRKFAGAAERFLGLELVSYACLLRDRQNYQRELRNIATLLIADLQTGVDAAILNNPPEEQR